MAIIVNLDVMMAKRKIGKVVHFYDKISVAIIDLTAGLKKGDEITITALDIKNNSIKAVNANGKEDVLHLRNKTKINLFTEKEMNFSLDEYLLKIKDCYCPWSI